MANPMEPGQNGPAKIARSENPPGNGKSRFQAALFPPADYRLAYRRRGSLEEDSPFRRLQNEGGEVSRAA